MSGYEEAEEVAGEWQLKSVQVVLCNLHRAAFKG